MNEDTTTNIGETVSLQLAHSLHRSGDLRKAETACLQLLQFNPQWSDVLHLLGIISLQLGREEKAIDYIREALRYRPDFAEAYISLGNARKQLAKTEEAVECYRQALRLRPDLAVAHNNLGNALREQGRLDEAIACFQQALQLRPDLAVLHYNLGKVYQQQYLLHEAIASYRQALGIAPQYPEALNNLGTVLKELGQLSEAVVSFQQALQSRPAYAEAQSNLGNALESLGLLHEAADCHRIALGLRPDLAEIHCNLGNTLKQLGHPEEAEACYRRALQLRPDLAVIHNNLGNTLKDQGQLDEAIACYRHAIHLRPDYRDAHSSLIYCLLYHPDSDEKTNLQEARLWSRNYAEPLAPLHQHYQNDPDPERRLRVGYVSPDFRDHPMAFFLVPLLAHHDHSQVEVFCYSGVRRPDPITDRIRGYADIWRSTLGLSDDRLSDMIHSDRIDVLVDITLHMAGCRLLTFARRPAPVQLTWGGYPGTTGLSAIEYRLTDPHLDPPDSDCSEYTEQSLRLPDTFWCYDPLSSDEPAVTGLPALRGEPFTFGCLNNFCKLNDKTLTLWASVLNAVPRSRLLILAPRGRARVHVKRVLEREGLNPDRVIFLDRQRRPDYLRTYHRIDLCLDPLPYNGHTTSLDAAWMGVPTITQVGRAVVGRAGLSLLRNLALSELAANSPEEYVAIASRLASDLPQLATLRASLRNRMAASPLMDAPRFCRGVENAYRKMWREWSQKELRTARPGNTITTK